MKEKVLLFVYAWNIESGIVMVKAGGVLWRLSYLHLLLSFFFFFFFVTLAAFKKRESRATKRDYSVELVVRSFASYFPVLLCAVKFFQGPFCRVPYVRVCDVTLRFLFFFS